jgi:aspartyl-tRNA(Asn)/glutamyl-tRNA(Gln) amidotransferase subunit B
MEWETVIGLEVHAQLKTNSKMFSGASSSYGAEPNTQACIVDLAMPGVLPTPNKEAFNMAIKFGLAVNANLATECVFARKNYFYPDLPKGYQISQHELPIVGDGGYLDIQLSDQSVKRIRITRAHLEEDTGKSLHEDFEGMSGIDLNRAGNTLLEIVTEPDMRSPEEAAAFLKKLHTLLRYLDICDGNMQEGSFRCDANVSVRPKGMCTFGTRTETKNINSFRFVEKAIQYEAERHINLVKNNVEIIQETRLFDSTTGETRSIRTKENVHDYRYFPDPDLLPVVITKEMVEDIRKNMPELPTAKRERFVNQYKITPYDANVLIDNPEMACYFEKVLEHVGAESKLVANWLLGDVSGALNKEGIPIINCPVSPEQLALLLNRISDNTISGKIAKTVFECMWNGEGSADEIVEKKGLKQVTDSTALESIIDEVIKNSPEEFAAYKAGKTKLFGYFVGEVMKATKGKANPQQANELLKKKL